MCVKCVNVSNMNVLYACLWQGQTETVSQKTFLAKLY